ncbi:NAD binding domain of 6-phosphogluconate dehydrogenase-domain-containing protein [Macrophomina phaseolina]|uniref:NAD binding domain of 6-phosphogluconate dehydrogenase-domain-containing protein n=1 Tax=Macrophomina phaseolina TaxID=35725 RepID=A0ABQ8GUW2_9PEZI|nr:NAD binding domain of 6-phosphogluconate dehydrogenase-domain-containing protein [Macrophomina phaseolina]
MQQPDPLSVTASPTLGWIGLGSMGLAMATNLQTHLHSAGASDLRYTNRTLSRGDSLRQEHAIPCPDVSSLISSSDIIFISLSDDAALNATVDAITQHAQTAGSIADKIFVDTSTVHPKTSSKAAAALAEKGAKFVAAPVFGASPVAAKGQLLFILAGPKDAVEAIGPFIVGVMGRGVIRLGEDVEKSSLLKTAGNFITAGMMELVAESHVFAEKTGLCSQAMEALIEQQYGPLALSMSRRLTTGAYMPAADERPWSDLKLALKDVGHGISCAEEAGSKLEVAEVALKHLQEAKRFSDARERPLDSSSMYGVLREQAGLAFETDLVKQRDERR